MTHKRLAFNIVSPTQGRSRPTVEIDWLICALCQTDDGRILVDSSKRKRNKGDDGYISLDTNLSSLNALPLNIDLSAINDGSGVETTLRNNNAKWHSSCS